MINLINHKVLFLSLLNFCTILTMLAQTDEQLLFQLDREWNNAIATNQPEKAASFFDTNAQLLVQNGPILKTHEEIKGFVSSMHAKGKMYFEGEAVTVELSASGDMAYLVGKFTNQFNGVVSSGKYVTLWKKQNGQWKIGIDIFNSD